jgi:hypothetical protein
VPFLFEETTLASKPGVVLDGIKAQSVKRGLCDQE